MSAELPPKIPGWGMTGSNPSGYVLGIDRADAYSGEASATLASKAEFLPGFGGLIQQISAAQYQGKRIRYSAAIKTSGVKYWAGLWFRADGADGTVVAFDNMQAPGRSLHGDTGWQRYSLILDIPVDAAAISFGAVLSGGGKIWFDAVQIEVVDTNVPLTAQPVATTTRGPRPTLQLAAEPLNADFEQ